MMSVQVLNRYLLERTLRRPVHPFPLVPKDEVAHPALLTVVQSAMKYDIGGVSVLWLPPGAGKSTILRRAAYELQKQSQISGAAYIDDLHNTAPLFAHGQTTSPFYALKAALGIPPNDKSASIGKFLSPQSRVVIILDQFDNLFKTAATPQAKETLATFVISLAEQSVAHKNYRVVIGLRNPELARHMLGWNGGHKIYSIPTNRTRILEDFKWNKDQASTLFSHVAKYHSISFAAADKERMVDLTAKAGRPGFLLNFIHCPQFGGKEAERTADRQEKEWVEGQELLSL